MENYRTALNQSPISCRKKKRQRESGRISYKFEKKICDFFKETKLFVVLLQICCFVE